MAKEKDIKNIEMIGDTTRTEGAPEMITGGTSFKAPQENFRQMDARRDPDKPNIRRENEAFKDLIDRQAGNDLINLKKQPSAELDKREGAGLRKPDLYYEAMKGKDAVKQNDKSKQLDKNIDYGKDKD